MKSITGTVVTKDTFIIEGRAQRNEEMFRYMMEMRKEYSKNHLSDIYSNNPEPSGRSSLYIDRKVLFKELFKEDTELEVIAGNLKMMYIRIMGTNVCFAYDYRNYCQLVDYEINMGNEHKIILPEILIKMNLEIVAGYNVRNVFRIQCSVNKMEELLESTGVSWIDKKTNAVFRNKQTGLFVHFLVEYVQNVKNDPDYYLHTNSLDHIYQTFDDRLCSTRVIPVNENTNSGSKEQFISLNSDKKISYFAEAIRYAEANNGGVIKRETIKSLETAKYR